MTPDDVHDGRGKPNPDPLLKACVEVGAAPSSTWFVGDMEADRLCAGQAGAVFVHAAWGYGSLGEVRDIWFGNVLDFVDYLLSY